MDNGTLFSKLSNEAKENRAILGNDRDELYYDPSIVGGIVNLYEDLVAKNQLAIIFEILNFTFNFYDSKWTPIKYRVLSQI